MLPGSTWSKIAPNTAVPNEPPIDRKKVDPDVAAPRSLYSTAFCTAITSTCMVPPDARRRGRTCRAELRQEAGRDGQQGQQVEPQRHRRRAQDREDLVAAPPADQLTGRNRGEQQPDHHRQQPQPRHGRGHSLDDLQVLRQVGERAEHREADHEPDRRRPPRTPGGGTDAAAAPAPRPAARPARSRREGDPGDRQGDDRPGSPGVGDAASWSPAPGRSRRRPIMGRSEVVDRVLTPAEVARERPRRRDQGDDADRQVDVEDPAPGQRVDEEAADQRPDHARHAEDGTEEALVAPRSRGGRMSPTMVCAPTNRPPPPRPCSARKAMSWAIDCDSPHSAEPIRKITIAAWKSALPPVLVAELAPQRRRDRGSQQVRR